MLVSSENLKKRPSANGEYSTSVPQVKWKPRKVSAVRDFPVRCGLDSLPVNMTHLEAAAPFLYTDDKVSGVAVSVAEVEVEIVGGDSGVETMLMENNCMGLSEESNVLEVGSNLVKKDIGEEEPNDVDVEATKKPNSMVAQVDGVMSLSATHKSIDTGHIQKGSGLKGKFSRRRVSAVRDFPPFCGWNALPPIEQDHSRINLKASSSDGDEGGASLKVTTPVIMHGKESQENGGDVSFDKSEMKGVFESKNVCRNKSTEVVGKDCVGSWRSMEDMLVGACGEESERNVRDLTVQKNESIVNMTGSRNKLQTTSNKEVVFVENQEKVGQEIVVYSRDKPLKRKRSDVARRLEGEESKGYVRDFRKDETELNSQVGNEGLQIIVYGDGKPLNSRPPNDAGGFGCNVEDRGVVQGLMASAFCPWKAGKEGQSSPNNVLSRKKVNRKPFSTPKMFMEKKAANGKKSVKGKSKSAYRGALDMVVRNEEDVAANGEEQNEDSRAGHGPQEFDVHLPPFGPKSSSDARNQVRETLRLFQAVCRKLLQGEESKANQGDEQKSKQHKRIDLAAARIVQEKGKEVNAGNKLLGAVPGVEVGDEFTYRVELALVGVHRLYQAGIDYIKYGNGKEKVAASIVASGGYDDELDSPDVLIYSGSGGVAGKGKKSEDQKLERGNLALKNSISLKNPVRVIRGSKESKVAESSDARAKLVATYVYVGLYTVERYWQDPGPQGTLVFKFELKRIPGQTELVWKEVKKSKKFKTREGLCVEDISGGKEVFPICAVNTVDNEKPPPFNYITKMMYPAGYNPIPPKGCACARQCYDKSCACALKNEGEIPYNRNGAIVEIKTLVYECGPSCNCPPSCYNRVTQHGIKIQLEIFKTETRGWGVRSLNSIPSGSFICEYIGELLEDTEAEKRTGNDEYLFDIGQNYSDCSVNPDAKSISSEAVEEGGYTIDAAEYGNVGRFVNHSCSPNLYAQNVLYDQEDKRMPHIMLFAAENIPPLQELTYHYNYAVNTVRDSNGNIKIKSCFCGSSECTGRLY